MYNCEEIRGRLALFIDNELQGDERSLMSAHLEACEWCRKALAEELELISAIRGARPSHEASQELRKRVENVLHDAAAPSTQSRPSDLTGQNVSVMRPKRSRLILSLAIAAAVIVLLMPVLVWKLGGDRTQQFGSKPSGFALMAAETHLRRTRGQLPLEIETASPADISHWFANKVQFSVQLPNYQESSGQDKLYTLEGGRLVGFKDDYAAYVAYRMSARPISLVITSDSVAKPSGGEEIVANGLTFHYDAIQGLKVITWSDRGLTYALVSDLEERGQQSCIVCHQGAKDRNLIEKLKPH